ncbi:hypothetical protein HAX54_003652, partial [Datura stramonium]|nr:hypothetical protein [Datura stramonium]
MAFHMTSIGNLEVQMGQISQALNSRPKGALPSNRVTITLSSAVRDLRAQLKLPSMQLKEQEIKLRDSGLGLELLWEVREDSSPKEMVPEKLISLQEPEQELMQVAQEKAPPEEVEGDDNADHKSQENSIIPSHHFDNGEEEIEGKWKKKSACCLEME